MASYTESASHPGKGKPPKHPQPPQPPQPEGTYHYKRLIVCCDGTWQRSDAPDKPTDPESSTDDGCIPESNVARMGRSLKRTAIVTKDGKTFRVPQVVYYQSGIGTTYLTRLAARFAGAVGAGLNSNVCEAYWFIANNWEKNDEIFLFGFSRGAYTARAVSGLISEIGILKREQLLRFQDIYDKYRHRSSNDDPDWEKYKAEHLTKSRTQGDDVKIKVVGVWDTVGSVGIPDNWLVDKLRLNRSYKFHNTELSKAVEHAFHALALDERRRHFTPAVWYLDPTPDPKRKQTPELKQVWLAGYHQDVGGGARDDARHPNDNSDISFAWMVDQCSPYLQFNKRAYEELETNNQAPPDPQNYGIQKLHDSNVKFWKLEIKKIRSPMEYSFPNKDKSGTLQNVVTNETVHPSVRIRMLKANVLKENGEPTWNPRALAGFELTKCEPEEEAARGVKWKWVKECTDNGKTKTFVMYEENIWEKRQEVASLSYGHPASTPNSGGITYYSDRMIREADKVLLRDEAKSLEIQPIQSLNFWTGWWEAISGLFTRSK